MKAALAILLAASVLAGCARTPKSLEETVAGPIQEMRQAILKNVADANRQMRLLSLVDELDGVLLEHAKDIRAHSEELRRLNADYDVTREAIDKSVAGYSQRARARRERALDLHFGMTGLTSAQEWKPVAKPEAQALGAARSYLSD